MICLRRWFHTFLFLGATAVLSAQENPTTPPPLDNENPTEPPVTVEQNPTEPPNKVHKPITTLRPSKNPTKGPFQHFVKDPNDTQTFLENYKEEIEEVYRKLPREDQARARRTLLTAANSNFNEYRKVGKVAKRRFEQHVDILVENLKSARSAFRFKDNEQIRMKYMEACTRIFMFEIEEATDLQDERTGQEWFQVYFDMMLKLRPVLQPYGRSADRIFSGVNPIFKRKLREMKISSRLEPAKNYEENMKLIKRYFPATTDTQKKQNGTANKLLRASANDLLRHQTKT